MPSFLDELYTRNHRIPCYLGTGSIDGPPPAGSQQPRLRLLRRPDQRGRYLFEITSKFPNEWRTPQRKKRRVINGLVGRTGKRESTRIAMAFQQLDLQGLRPVNNRTTPLLLSPLKDAAQQGRDLLPAVSSI